MGIKALLSRFKFVLLLLGMLTTVMLVGDIIPMTIKSFFYTISILIKNIIVFFLPLLIFVFLSGSLITLQSQAGRFLVLLLILVTLSNFIAIIVGYTIGVHILPMIEFNTPIIDDNVRLVPLWHYNFPQIINVQFTILISIAFGLFFAFKPNQYIKHISQKINKVLLDFLGRYFIPILPLFILGFIFKLEYEKALLGLITLYGPILLLIASIQLLYIIIMCMIASNFKLHTCAKYIKNIMPATITGLSTASSAATLPVTILCTKKNLHNPTFSKIIVPATCNIHTVGSAIGLTIMALATMKAFKMTLPDLKHFIHFAIYYTLAKYAVAGVPGGVVVVAAPLLELYLGFTTEMISMVTAVYLLFDSYGTAINVTGNSIFAIIFSKIYHKNNLKSFR